MLRSFCLCGFLVTLAFSQTVDLRGMVHTQDMKSIAGAVVTLQQLGLRDTTDTLGYFEIKKQETSITNSPASPLFRVNKFGLQLNLERKENVRLRMFSLSGRLLETPVQRWFSPGNHLVRLKNLRSVRSKILELSVGDRTWIVKPHSGKNELEQMDSFSSLALKRAEVKDTLKVSYKHAKTSVPISNLTDSINITLDLTLKAPEKFTRSIFQDSSGTGKFFSGVETKDGGIIAVGDWDYGDKVYSDVLITKYDSLGKILWNKKYGNYWPGGALKIVSAHDSGYFISAVSTPSSTGPTNIHLLKIKDNGDTLWTKTHWAGGWFSGTGMVPTKDGGYAFTGHISDSRESANKFMLMKVDGSGNMKWKKTYGFSGLGKTIVETADGGFAAVGLSYDLDVKNVQLVLIKTDANGTKQWAKSYGGDNREEGVSLTQLPDGGYVASGYNQSINSGSNRIWLLRTDSLGNTSWSKTYHVDAGYGTGRSVIQTNDGNILVVGALSRFDNSKTSNVFMMKTDGEGKELWSKDFRASVWESAHQVIELKDKDYALFGSTRDSVGEQIPLMLRVGKEY